MVLGLGGRGKQATAESARRPILFYLMGKAGGTGVPPVMSIRHRRDACAPWKRPKRRAFLVLGITREASRSPPSLRDGPQVSLRSAVACLYSLPAE